MPCSACRLRVSCLVQAEKCCLLAPALKAARILAACPACQRPATLTDDHALAVDCRPCDAICDAACNARNVVLCDALLPALSGCWAEGSLGAADCRRDSVSSRSGAGSAAIDLATLPAWRRRIRPSASGKCWAAAA